MVNSITITVVMVMPITIMPNTDSRVMLNITGMDLVTTEEEVAEAISKKLNGKKDFTIGEIRENSFGNRITIVRMSRMDADKIMRTPFVKIGGRVCNTKVWYGVPLCDRCQQIGHQANRCRAPQPSRRRCHTVNEVIDPTFRFFNILWYSLTRNFKQRLQILAH